MREAVRQQYLKAMGIPVWVPRQALPNAADSQLLPWLGEGTHLHGNGDMPVDHLPDYRHPEDHHPGGHMAAQLLDHGQSHEVEAATQPANSARTAATAAQPQREAAAVEPPASSTELTGPATTAPATSVLSTPAPVDMTPPRFELHFVRFGEQDIWVCEDYQELEHLLAFAPRVCAGMGWNVLREEPVMFRWPFIENAREDQSAAVAEQALRAQWNYFSHHGGKRVIAFGPTSQRWLQNALAIPGCYMSQPIQDIMASGALKKQLWLSLLALEADS